ncbi:MAG TPA: extracellular solute-binding protein [Vicinamibacteria bacterium]|nr:extracellular solute-binding protein [Vicinamibacteria bacterium]
MDRTEGLVGPGVPDRPRPDRAARDTLRRHRALALFSLLVYLFLYAPLLVLMALSFNRSRLTARWEGFTLEWYARALRNPEILSALRTSVLVAVATTALATAIGTAAALFLHRRRLRRAALVESLLLLPIVVPEIVMGSSLLVFFAALGLRLGLATVVAAHVGFSVSYAVIVVRARLRGLDGTLEEAAMDLGAGPWRTFWHVTLPSIAPGILAAALLVFALSIDDYVITSFVAGVGATTLPLQIYSMVKSGVSPEINAVSTVLLAATGLMLAGAHLFEQGRTRAAAPAAALGLLVLGGPFLLGAGGPTGSRVLNVYIWSNYIAPETVRTFESRHGARVRVDLYDTNEALLAKVQAGNAGYDVICPSNYVVQILLRQSLLRPLDRSALPHFGNLDPRFVGLAHDPGNRYSVPYFWGTAGIGYDRRRTGPVDSWAALWDPRFRGRILMLDDARETFGAALKWRGRSLNATDPALLRMAQGLLLTQKPLVRAYNSSNFEDVLLSRDVWLAQGWSGQLAKAMDQDGDLDYVVPKEGSSLFLDSLAVPRDAPHPELAHAFIDFVLEAEVAAEICRTMRYSTPNRAALPLLPEAIRRHPAIFPPEDVLARVELIEDLGEATVLYDRLWTEVKTSR